MTRGRNADAFFRLFNSLLRRAVASGYSRSVGGVLSRKALMMGIYLIFLLGTTGILFKAVPDGFVPQQDKQYLIGFAQLPTARRSTEPRT